MHYGVRSGNAEDAQVIQAKSDVQRSMRLKQLKKTIQDDLGIQDRVTIKLYLNGEEILDEKLTVEDANILQEGSTLEVEVTIKVIIEVLGKGKGY